MSLSDNYKPVKYIGNGTTKDFSFNFNMINREYCRVFLEDKTTGAQTPKNLDADYTLVFDDNGGQVSMKVAPLASQYIVVYRDVDLNQKSDFRVGEGFAAVKIEDEFDKQMAAIQQMDDGLNRSPKVAEGYSGSLTLPNPDAGKALIWNANENGFKNSTVDVDHLEAITQQYRYEAEAARDAARVSESNAKASENAAKASQTAAAASASSAANTVNGFDAHAADKQRDFDTNAANKTNAFNQNAAQKQAAVDASAEEAHKWAVGTIQEQPSGSAKYWAENAKAVTDGTLNETQITNCITKIPQDIKLELSNGTLTLKAGSKVYVPNGVGVFKEILVNSDISLTDTTNYNNLFVFYNNGILERILTSQVFSGTAAPSTTTFLYWYDTTNNLIKRTTNGGDTWTSGNISFPLGLFSTNGTGFSSIDQVFNGFGYIGRTIFSLPGVEGLIPSGRNTDGSLNNAKFMTTKVTTINNGVSLDNAILAYFTGTSVLTLTYSQNYYHNNQENYNYFNGIKTAQFLLFGTLNADSTGRVTSFSPKLPVKLADNQEVVHKTGNETIEGEKIFTSNITISNPNGVSIMQCVDPANTNNNAKIQYYVGDNSASFTNVQNGSTIGGIIIDNSGYAYSIKPPVATDKSTQIATTQWVRNYGAQLDYSAAITISGTGTKTASVNGVLIGTPINNNSTESLKITIDGKTFYFTPGNVGEDNCHLSQCYLPVAKGQSYNVVEINGNVQLLLVPYV